MTAQVVLGLGHGGDLPVLAGPGTEVDGVVDMGPRHPTLHGTLRLALEVDGDLVVAAEPLVGAMHRGAEKLFEVRDYRQALVLANRHDWLSAFASELCLAMVVERMCGITVPPRAVWLRTTLAELTRVLSHLSFVVTYPGVAGDVEARGWRARETAVALLESATGGRVHTMAVRVGGLVADVPEGWTDRLRDALPELRSAATDLLDTVERGDADRGVAILSRAAAAAFGVTGPVGRASGLDIDLRRDEPYLAYPDLASQLTVIGSEVGDSHARITCRAAEILASLQLLEAACRGVDDIGHGDVSVLLPKVLRVPEGHGYAWTENPLGIAGYYLVSTGDKVPWRLKMRTASFNNAAALSAALPGTRLADLPAALAGWGLVIGDLDR